jgi:hypothetical protein
VLVRILIPLCWTLWAILLLVVLYGLVRVSTEQTSSPEAGRGLGIFAVLFLMALLAVAAVLLNVAARRESPSGLIIMTLLLAYPLVSLVAHPAIQAYKRRSFASAEARVGDFSDPTLQAMARAISDNDTQTLAQLLKGQLPPDGKDRAGNDLLAYALVVVRDKQGSADPVRVLLDAGADPRKTRAGSGQDVVNFMIHGGSPAAREAMRLLLAHGADPDAVDPQSGSTPIGAAYNEPELVRLLVAHGADIDRIQPDGVPAVVGFISTRQWESALYLIEKGANLDVRNANGLSVDYYLNDWKESVYGEHPEGWDKVREAIAERRATGNRSGESGP